MKTFVHGLARGPNFKQMQFPEFQLMWLGTRGGPLAMVVRSQIKDLWSTCALNRT
jgi:hypothetical protein